jgi:serine protease
LLRIGGIAVAVVAVLVTAFPVAASASESQTTGRLLVTLNARGARASVVDAIAARNGARVALPPVDEIRLAVLAPVEGQSTAALAARLRADSSVVSVRPERTVKLDYVPNDPAFSLPLAGAAPGTVQEWWGAGADLFNAWNLTTGSNATVAIIDTGIDATHPEFKGKIKHKVDFDRDAGHKGAGFDEVGHGTHVASLACAAPDNGFGIAGSGRGCKLLIAKTDLTEGSIASSIVWAVRHHADAINMSFGTASGSKSSSPEMRRAVRYAFKRDAVMVAAAADEPRLEQGDPANLLQPTGTGRKLNSSRNKGLTVTAATAANQRASFAGRGSQISLAAYGSYGSAIGSPGLLGAFPANTTEIERGSFRPPIAPCGCRVTINGDNRFAQIQGTSMAAPLVAGVVAMVRGLNPDLDNRAVIKLIKRTAQRRGGWNSDLGWGILDAGKALRAAANADARAPRSKIRTAKGSGPVKLTWAGADKGPRAVRVTGIAKYDVYRVLPDGTKTRVKRTTRQSATVSAAAGDGFYTVAIDGAGNKEKAPKNPDVVVK